jgi:predicted nucleic acid-binding protein
VVLPVTLADTDRAREILCGSAAVSARDCVHAAVMLNHGVESIATFDQGFDGIAGIRRMRLG